MALRGEAADIAGDLVEHRVLVGGLFVSMMLRRGRAGQCVGCAAWFRVVCFSGSSMRRIELDLLRLGRLLVCIWIKGDGDLVLDAGWTQLEPHS